MVWSENVMYIKFNLGNLAIRKSHPRKLTIKKNSWKRWSMKIRISFRKDSNPLCPLTPPSPSLVLHPKSKVWSLKRKEGRIYHKWSPRQQVASFPSQIVKFRYCEKATKFEKKYLLFWKLLVTSKQSRRFFVFWEYLNSIGLLNSLEKWKKK